jgi:glycosyltransferase involved in cell wall biosynthesis
MSTVDAYDRMSKKKRRTVSCVIPARNESGHLEQIVNGVSTVPEIDYIIIVEGGSTDATYEIAENLAGLYPKKVYCFKQSKKGKFNAVLEGSNYIESDFVIVWDADGTVPIDSTRTLINTALENESLTIGDRLRGQMEKEAMQTANKIGNWLFALLWSPFLKSKPTDLFCGTKVGPSEVFRRVPQYFLQNDPYGDIALLVSARILNIPINSLPVNYKARVYGESKMRRWSTGLIFLKLTFVSYKYLLKPRRKLINGRN